MQCGHLKDIIDLQLREKLAQKKKKSKTKGDVDLNCGLEPNKLSQNRAKDKVLPFGRPWWIKLSSGCFVLKS